MDRRRFVALIGGALTALLVTTLLAPQTSMAQQKMARVGVLNSAGRPAVGRGIYGVLFDALAKAGWSEGRNLAIDWRFADGSLARHDVLAAELVALNPDVIVAGTQPAALAVFKATRTIPIVFTIVQEPVESGLAHSLARPGGNATGLASMNKELIVKRLDLMHDVFPKAKRIALLYQPDFDMNVRQAALAETAAQVLGLNVVRVGIGDPRTYDAAFAALARERPDVVLVIENPSVYARRDEIVRRMRQAQLPAMYGLQEFSLVGGLLSYSINFADQYRRAADYVDRILRGAKPGELPIQQPLNFEFTVNLGTARALGMKIPQSVLLRADRVIE
jgi:putative tryptophan/tyrosine transport system substrate-binding protein